MTRRQLLAAGAAGALGRPLAALAQGAGPLAGLRAERPRLLVTPAELATLEARLAADETGKRWRAASLREAERLLGIPPMERAFEPRRPVLLPTSREVLKRIETLGAAYLLTGEARFARRAGDEAERVCGWESWNPSHFLDVAEMTMAMALALDWCGGALGSGREQAVRAAIVGKGLGPGREEFRKRAFWTRAIHNWNLVCNGGLVAGALAVAEAEPALAAEIVETAVASARGAFASYGPDGGWDEGVAYWDYATQYAVFLAASLQSALGHDFGLSDAPGFTTTGDFRLHLEGPTGKAFNFADGSESVRHTPALMWLAARFDRPLDAWIAGRNATTTGTGLLWYRPHGRPPQELAVPRDARFRRVEAAAFRSAWGDRGALFVAVKAGDNAANHSNLDLGSFVLDAGGERFAIELGPDDYALPGYFSADKRFAYYRTGTAGQNALIVDGANQPAKAKAALGAFASREDFACAVADLGAAYPALGAARRGVALIERRLVAVADEFAGPAGLGLRWQMHTRAAVRTEGASAELRHGNVVLHARILAPAGAVFAVEPATRPPPENPNSGVSRLQVDGTTAGGPGRIVVAFAPAPPSEADLARALRPLAEWA